MQEIAPLLGMSVLTLVVGWIIHTISDNRRRKETARLQSEMQLKLIDRFGSPEELLRYLGSDAGRKFVESASLERTNPFRQILGSVQAGILLVAVAIGLFLVQGILGAHGDPALQVLGVVVLMLGLGFLASAAASYLLSRRFGLLQQAGSREA